MLSSPSFISGFFPGINKFSKEFISFSNIVHQLYKSPASLKYSKLKTNSQTAFEKTTKEIENCDKEIIKNFLELYDKEVKKIHSNEERIEKNLQLLYAESLNLQKNANEACKIYDELVEYFKEAGDLYNWCTILEKEMNSLENIFIPGKNPEPKDENNTGENNDNK